MQMGGQIVVLGRERERVWEIRAGFGFLLAVLGWSDSTHMGDSRES